jgi:hypothetical protein
VGGTRILTDTTGRQLEMDLDTGLFYYYDANRTFSTTVSAVGAASLLTEDDAKAVADQFLAQHGLLSGDAVFNTVEPVQLSEVAKGGFGYRSGQVLSQQLTAYEVIYSRYISTTVTEVSAAGVQTTHAISIPVDGEGAKLKIYVSPTGGLVQAASAAQTGAVIGGQGSWRPVGATAAGATAEVPILDFDPQIQALFQQLEPEIAYAQVPFPGETATSKTVLTYTVTAYEESSTESQDVLYPAYRLFARYEGPTNVNGVTETVVFTGFTWLPANPEYMRPFAKIVSTSDVSQPLQPGSVVNATAEDASKQLSALGFDASLNFAMGKGPYTYNWYRNEVSDATKIGTGRNLNYTIPLSADGAKEGLITSQIILVVTDVGSTHNSLNTSTRSFQVTAVSPLYLPIIIR